LDAGGEWSIQFPDQHAGIKCGAVVLGQCWLSVEGVADAVHLTTGDSFLLPRGRPFRLAHDMASASVESAYVFSTPCQPGIASFNGGGDFRFISTRYVLDGAHASVLLRMLPPIVHIRGSADQGALQWPVEQMMQELVAPRPGGGLMLGHLAHMMLIHALRQHMTEAFKNSVGWLFALADNHMAVALHAMHDDPGHRWTLQELAARCGMSRSSFAVKFKRTVGTSAMDYLAHWRMLLASDRLKNTNDSISTIAPSLGYESDTAFSMAFKKIMGSAPRQYSRESVTSSASEDKAEIANVD
jgi:AraC-like DNA-binding protein